MYKVKDSGAYSNPWLYLFDSKFCWGPQEGLAHEFSSEQEALRMGEKSMPTKTMKKRVEIVPC